MREKIKSLASDTIVYGVFQVIGRFLSFLLTPLYTNYLTKTELAEITYIYSILAFLNIIFSFGLESSYFRFYDKNNPEQCRKVFTNSVFVIGSIAATVALVVLLTADLFAYDFVELYNAPLIIRIAILIPFFDSLILIPYAYLRMTRKARKFAQTRLLLIIIAVANNIIFVVILKYGALGVVLSQLIASSLGIFVLFKDIKNNLIKNIDFKLIKEMFKFGLPTLPANLSAMILQVADRPFLKALATTNDLAVYAVNYRLAIPMMIVVTVFDYAWKPFYLSRYNEDGAKELFSRIFTYYVLFCSAIFLITSFYIEYVVRLPFIGGRFIEPSYWSGLAIVPVILAAFFINGSQSHFAAGFLITKNTKYVGISVGLGAVVSLLMNFILIPIISYWGSAIAIVIGYLVGASNMYLHQQKIYPIHYEWRRVWIIIFSTAVVFFLGKEITLGLEMRLAFLLRTIMLFLYVLILYMLRFFNAFELNQIKNILKINKKHTL